MPIADTQSPLSQYVRTLAQWIALLVCVAAAVDSSLADEARDPFVEQILPLIESKCVACHGREKQEGGLRLDSLAAAKQGGDTGPAVVPGDVGKSLLVKAISFRDPDLQMPPAKKLADAEIDALTKWVKEGARWPEPVAVLFEDEPKFLESLVNGNGRGRVVSEKPFGGRVALGMTPLQRDNPKIPGWAFVIRENPQPGEYRYLRFAWKKQGDGSVMIELASHGKWPDARSPKGRYVAGPNSTGWAAMSVSNEAPAEWTAVTVDVWKDLGETTLTGFAPTCDRGQEAFFDSIILGPSLASLEAYRPGAGLPSDADSTPIGDAFTDKRNPIRKLFRGERLDLWSLKSPEAPKIDGEAAPTIDLLIGRKLAEAGIKPADEADRRTLLRRVTLDLTGLPPSAEELTEFLNDQSPDAYEKAVTRLLDSPQYGERQSRLWLDVVRYADTNGYERDEFRPLAWQYRDYVVRSFNQDKPFDQFIREQLAGDELVNGSPRTEAEADSLIATGFLRLGQWDSTASIFQEEPRLQAEQMADLTNTTASAFLGLTMSCCQCHDHKYDPFSQADHFRLRAFFAGVTPRDDLAITLAEEQAAIDAWNAELDKQAAPIKASQKKVKKDDKDRHDELKAKLDEIDGQRRQPRVAMGAADAGTAAPATHIFFQGDFASPREEVSPGFVSVFDPNSATIEVPREGTTGRRSALANWIASPRNPWTSRVIVNRIWQQHFGQGLVATPNDFGFSGARPTHPELLDWLAIEFTQQGWSLKRLHRMIVMSATYRRQSNLPAGDRSRPDLDPDNDLLGRQNVRRLDAEALRDSLLAVSGLLKSYDGGKPLWPEVPEELLKAQPAILEAEKGGDGGRMQGWYPDPVEQTDVRSLYLIRKRCLPIPFLQAFDLPDTTVSCARRDSTVVAPQALMFLNSPEAVRFAEAFAERVAAACGPLNYDDAAKCSRIVDHVFQFALGRSADVEEQKLGRDLLERHAKRHHAAGRQGSAEQHALADLCRAVLNLNEFAYVD